jgi:hypothetical protein
MKLGPLVKVVEAVGAADAGVVVTAAEVAEVAAEVVDAEVAEDVTAAIEVAEAAATGAGNRHRTIELLNFARYRGAGKRSPVLFCANLFIAKIQGFIYAFPRKFLWLRYTSKMSPKNCTRRFAAAPTPGGARSPRRSLPCSKKTYPQRKN